MHPTIRKFSSDTFYNGQILDDDSVHDRYVHEIFTKRVIFFDLMDNLEMSDFTSKYNPTEIKLSMAICKYILYKTKGSSDIGIISPYKS